MQQNAREQESRTRLSVPFQYKFTHHFDDSMQGWLLKADALTEGAKYQEEFQFLLKPLSVVSHPSELAVI